MDVTLTFDNGPHPQGTPRVLDELSRRDIPAVFFVVGSRLAGGGRGLVERAHDEGHVIGNHTWSHEGPLGGRGTDALDPRDEILRTQEALAGLSADPPLFRPVGRAPGGIVDDHLLDERSAALLAREGYTVALWNVLPHDWDDPDGWPARAQRDIRQHAHAVVVLHDAYPAGMTHLGRFLDHLDAAGARFTTSLPSDCTPMIAGRATDDLGPLIHRDTAHDEPDFP